MCCENCCDMCQYDDDSKTIQGLVNELDCQFKIYRENFYINKQDDFVDMFDKFIVILDKLKYYVD